MHHIQTRPAIAGTYIDDEVMQNTLKLSCRQYTSTSDVIMLMKMHGISTEDVLGLYRGPPIDASYFVTFATEEPIQKLRSVVDLSYRNKKFVLTQLGKQVITVRVHWLPLYFSDSLIKATLADYGTVLSIEKATTIHDKTHVKNGMRIVKLEVDEKRRLEIPHLVKFACGTAILMTINGRPPLCLRCSEIGHLRRDCPQLRDSYSAAVRATYREPGTGNVEQQTPPPPEDDIGSGDVGQSETGDGQTLDHDDKEADGVDPPLEGQDEEEMETTRAGIKRGRGEDNTDSFREQFPANKHRSAPAMLAKQESPIQTSNMFSILDLDSSPLIFDEQDDSDLVVDDPEG